MEVGLWQITALGKDISAVGTHLLSIKQNNDKFLAYLMDKIILQSIMEVMKVYFKIVG